MIKHIKTIFIFLSISLIFTLASCKKDSEPVPVQPDLPQLVGTWQGTTSQNQLFRIGIMNLEGILIVNTYKYDVIKYYTDTTFAVKSFDFNLSTIVTSVVGGKFGFLPQGSYSSGDYLKGVFDTATMTLTGQFRTSFPTATGTSVDIVNGTYTAVKVSD